MSQMKVLFPTDFSHTGDAALEMATSIARDRGGKLLIVHVEEPPAVYGAGEMYYGIPEPAPEDLKRMLEKVTPAGEPVPYEHHLVTGEPANGIIRLAEAEGVDLIVLGTHGRTGISRLLMGSVAEIIVRRASCPVLVVKQPRRHSGVDD